MIGLGGNDKWKQLKSYLVIMGKSNKCIAIEEILKIMDDQEKKEKYSSQNLTEICIECHFHLFRDCVCNWGNEYKLYCASVNEI